MKSQDEMQLTSKELLTGDADVDHIVCGECGDTDVTYKHCDRHRSYYECSNGHSITVVEY